MSRLSGWLGMSGQAITPKPTSLPGTRRPRFGGKAREVFIKALEGGANQVVAARIAGTTDRTVRRTLDRSPAFRAAVEKAQVVLVGKARVALAALALQERNLGALKLLLVNLAAYSGHREHPDRSIVNTWIGRS